MGSPSVLATMHSTYNRGGVISNPRSIGDSGDNDYSLQYLYSDSPATLLHEAETPNAKDVREQVRAGNRNLLTVTPPQINVAAAQAAEDSLRDAGNDNHGYGGDSGLKPGEFF